jgi:hypothetical protein
MQVHENLIDALDDLKRRGFTTDFKLIIEAVACVKTGINLSPLILKLQNILPV